MKKFFISILICATIFFGSSCSLSYFFKDYSAYYAGIVYFEETYGGLAVDIPTIGVCVIPSAEKVYYLNDCKELENGDLIKIAFVNPKKEILIMESYPARLSAVADYIEVQAKNVALKRSNEKLFFSQPINEATRDLSVGDPLYFIKNGGENGKAYRELFCASTVSERSDEYVSLQLSFHEEDLLGEFLFYYASLEQTPIWERF